MPWSPHLQFVITMNCRIDLLAGWIAGSYVELAYRTISTSCAWRLRCAGPHHFWWNFGRANDFAHRPLAQEAALDLADHRRGPFGRDRLGGEQRDRADDEGKPAFGVADVAQRRAIDGRDLAQGTRGQCR